MSDNHNRPISHEERAKAMSGLASLLWILVALIITIMLGVFFYLSPLFDSFKTKTEVPVNQPAVVVPIEPVPKQEEPEYDFYEVLPKQEFRTSGSISGNTEKNQTEPKESVDAVVVAKKEKNSTNTTTEDQPVNHDVTVVEEQATYDDTTVPNTTTKPEGKIVVTGSNNTYILQVRSFDNAEDADRMRSDVMLAGVDARVVVRNDRNGTIYQVISNVMNSRAEVMRASQKLSDNGIDSLIVEQKR